MARIKLNELNQSRFYMTPKELYLNPTYREVLDNNARHAYAILRDRLELSRKNKWVNENGEVFLKFKREKLANLMTITRKTLSKSLDKLKLAGLIDEERVGQGKVNRIFVSHMESISDDSLKGFEEEYYENLEDIFDYSEDNQTVEPVVMGKNYPSSGEKITHLEGKKLPIKTLCSKPTATTLERQDFPSSETYSSETYSSETTTTSKIEYIGNNKEKENTVVVVVDKELVNLTKKEIDKTIKDEISKNDVKELISIYGIDKVKFYIDNWDKFKGTSKNSVIGFFKSAVKVGYKLPKSESAQYGTPDNMNNFDQREITPGEYDDCYYKVRG